MKNSGFLKTGTAVTLAATTILGAAGCAKEAPEKSQEEIYTTGIYEESTIPSQEFEIIDDFGEEKEETTKKQEFEINRNESIGDVKANINSIYKKYFGVDNQSVDSVVFKGVENNIAIGDEISITYPEGSSFKNSEDKYIVSLSIYNITNKEALNGFLEEVFAKYNINELKISDEALALVNVNLNKVNELIINGTGKLSSPVSLSYISDVGGLTLNSASVCNIPSSVKKLYIYSTKDYNEYMGITNYVPYNEIKELPNFKELKYLDIVGVDLVITHPLAGLCTCLCVWVGVCMCG